MNSNSLPASVSLDSNLKKGPRPIVQSPSLPDGWEEDVVPNGQLVYSKLIDSRDCHIRVNTDLALSRTKNHSAMNQAIEKLSDLAKICDELQSDAALKRDVIEACILVPEHPETPEEFGYYLVNHRDRIVFWLEDIDLEKLGLKTHDADILRLKLEVLYWRHIKSLVEIQRHHMMQPHSLAFMRHGSKPNAKETQTATERSATGYVASRLWYDIIAPRAHNNWGTDYARLERVTKLENDEKPSENAGPWLIQWLCTFFLWNEPAVTLKSLDEALLGGIIYLKPWQSTMEEFSNEWEKILILSAITFAGAMAFLAVPIPSVPGNDNSPSNPKPSIIMSFGFLCGILCCVFSIASMIAAVNLKRDYGGKIKDNVHEAKS
ncbi:hypothetical protein FRC05_001068 [Tulasnella sp. 425]|nr:hypothetical protein FRC05_001068 [Tulasnella sp. 425]